MKICTNTGDSDSVTLSNGIAVMSIDFWRMASEAGELMWCGEACVEDLLGELDGDTICLQTGNIVNEKEGHRQIMSNHVKPTSFTHSLPPAILPYFGIACHILPYLATAAAWSSHVHQAKVVGSTWAANLRSLRSLHYISKLNSTLDSTKSPNQDAPRVLRVQKFSIKSPTAVSSQTRQHLLGSPGLIKRNCMTL